MASLQKVAGKSMLQTLLVKVVLVRLRMLVTVRQKQWQQVVKPLQLKLN